MSRTANTSPSHPPDGFSLPGDASSFRALPDGVRGSASRRSTGFAVLRCEANEGGFFRPIIKEGGRALSRLRQPAIDFTSTSRGTMFFLTQIEAAAAAAWPVAMQLRISISFFHFLQRRELERAIERAKAHEIESFTAFSAQGSRPSPPEDQAPNRLKAPSSTPPTSQPMTHHPETPAHVYRGSRPSLRPSSPRHKAVRRFPADNGTVLLC